MRSGRRTVGRYRPPEVLVETTQFRDTQTSQVPSGWATFAAVVIGVVGVWHILSGIAAVAEDDQTEAIQDVLYGVDITAWGWFWLIVGALQVLTAVLIFGRNPSAKSWACSSPPSAPRWRCS